MKRKLQIFVSSTFSDLRDERQAAVEAILKAGHIPAGMELFTAGSESQLQVIRRWIEDSDVYLLILGGRYGSIEPKSQLSYTEVEFDYARSLDKPFFSVVITTEGLEQRVRERGTSVLEKENETKLRAFRDKVTSQLCAFWSGPKDVKLAVFESLPQFTEGVIAGGWVSAREVAPTEDVARQLTALLEENQKLRIELREARTLAERTTGEDASLERLRAVLSAQKVTVPTSVIDPGPGIDPVKADLLTTSIVYADDLARGVSNAMNVTKVESFLFHSVAAHLASYGLAEEGKVPTGVMWQRLKLSKEGIRFLTWARLHGSSAHGRESTIENPETDTKKLGSSGEPPVKKQTKGRGAK